VLLAKDVFAGRMGQNIVFFFYSENLELVNIASANVCNETKHKVEKEITRTNL